MRWACSCGAGRGGRGGREIPGNTRRVGAHSLVILKGRGREIPCNTTTTKAMRLPFFEPPVASELRHRAAFETDYFHHLHQELSGIDRYDTENSRATAVAAALESAKEAEEARMELLGNTCEAELQQRAGGRGDLRTNAGPLTGSCIRNHLGSA